MYKYEKAVKYLNDNGVDKKMLIGMVHGLYQDYKIEEDEEEFLYEIIDPEEEFNDCYEYWSSLEERVDELYAYIDELPEYSDDDKWFYNGEDIMSYDYDDVECLADLLEQVLHTDVHTGEFEDSDGTGYTGMAYINFD